MISRTVEFFFLKHHLISRFGTPRRESFIHLFKLTLCVANGIARWIPPFIVGCTRSLVLYAFNTLWLLHKSLIKCLYFSEESFAFRVLDIQDRSEVLLACQDRTALIASFPNFVELLGSCEQRARSIMTGLIIWSFNM